MGVNPLTGEDRAVLREEIKGRRKESQPRTRTTHTAISLVPWGLSEGGGEPQVGVGGSLCEWESLSLHVYDAAFWLAGPDLRRRRFMLLLHWLEKADVALAGMYFPLSRPLKKTAREGA